MPTRFTVTKTLTPWCRAVHWPATSTSLRAGTGPASGLFAQGGAVAVVCWLVMRQSDSLAAMNERLMEEIAANRDEMRGVESRCAERGAKHWEEIRRLREAIQAAVGKE